MLRMAPLKDTLRRERRRAGLTQEELADKADVGHATIARIEAGYINAPRVSRSVTCWMTSSINNAPARFFLRRHAEAHGRLINAPARRFVRAALFNYFTFTVY